MSGASTVGHGNWGRWGADDERGALNLVDAAATLRAVASVRRGEAITLGLPLQADTGPVARGRAPMRHFMHRDGGDYLTRLDERHGYGYADDSILVGCHGTTHLDALAHVWRDGVMWNGHSATTVSSRGAARCGIETVGAVVTRALVVDLAREGGGLTPGEPVDAGRLDAAVSALGVDPQPGDALLVRTGWLAQWRAGTASTASWPGLAADCAEWLRDHDIALVGADNIAVEVSPSGVEGSVMPLHVAAIRDCGVFFLELLDLERLAISAASIAMLVVAPLNIVGGSGSPCAPVAVI